MNSRNVRVVRAVDEAVVVAEEEDVLTEALQDHFGRPDSICRHPNKDDPELDRLRTNGSYVMDLNERRLLGTGGPSYESEYQESQLQLWNHSR